MSDYSSKQNYKRLLGYVKDYRAMFVLSIIGMIGYASVDTFVMGMLQVFIDHGLTEKNKEILGTAPFFVVGLFLLRGLFNFMSSYGLSWVGSQVVVNFKNQLFQHFMDSPVSFHDQNSTGELMSKILYETEQVQQACTKALIVLVREGVFVIGLFAVMFYHSWVLSSVLIILAPIVAVIVKIVSKRFRKISQNLQQAAGDVTRSTEQMLKGHKVILSFGGQKLEAERFAQMNKVNRQQRLKMDVTSTVSVSVIQLIASVALAFVLFMASFPEIVNSLTAGQFTSLLSCMVMLLRPLKQLTTVNSEFQKGMAACGSLFRLLDMEKEQNTGTVMQARVDGEIQIKDLTFTYPTKEEPALKSLSLSIPKGKTVALVGRSGSGKSTLSNLLPRFYEIEEGHITIDGIPVQDFELKSLRRQFAIVSQQVILFNDTIANNIAYAMPDVTCEQIENAAKLAFVSEFTDKLPEGLDTLVGENGVMLSGGQRQRIAIARALLRDAPILILDEATSALDTESEKMIQKALDNLQKERTSLVIAHRLSTIENADEIIVLDHGQIIEQGDHQTLLDKGGAYAALRMMQFGEG
ncbi:lipid A export permease/ATP-binding protein MsbA [Algicola sagamiensis]|uniref:lipid A export permease/ATP-binding protein MsbA n=1 Tax=Algicola sagamiensis TaxID=163869 RepID=UPI00035C52AC|nr:lipid A export permease/ATP-binding protein MsbA [Algicola sagamiensis]